MSPYRYSNLYPVKVSVQPQILLMLEILGISSELLSIVALPLLLGREQKLLTYNTVQTTPLIVAFLLVAEWVCARAGWTAAFPEGYKIWFLEK